MKNGRYEEGGEIFWYLNDKFHRLDGPAMEYPNGTKVWLLNDKMHRADGPAVEWNGIRDWYLNGERHRDDGPAVEWEGRDGRTIKREWWLNGERHREDGPAIEGCDGSQEWYLFGLKFTEEDFQRLSSKIVLNKKLQSTLEPRHKEMKKKKI
jgi:hypothetical protein